MKTEIQNQVTKFNILDNSLKFHCIWSQGWLKKEEEWCQAGSWL